MAITPRYKQRADRVLQACGPTPFVERTPMSVTCTLDGTLVDGLPPRLALYPYGGFTTFVAIEGGVRGWSRHEDRLATATLDLWGHELDRALVRRRVREHLALTGERCVSARVTLWPAEFSIAAPEQAAGCTVVITSTPAPESAQAQAQAGTRPGAGLRVHTVEHERRLAHLKTTDLFAQIAIRREARAAGFDDALLVAGDRVLEGVTWSVLVWRDQEVVTPGGGVLPSVTVCLMEEVARSLGRRFSRGVVTPTDLRSAELVLAVSVNAPARALTEVDGALLQVDGELLASVARAYEALPLERV